MLDLRRQTLEKNASYVKPSDSKQKDFHLALADYLYKELKKSDLNISKHNVLLKISLQKKHQDKYEHVIIDCLEGKLYLRGSEVYDRYFGRLTKFSGGQRASDAYHCAIQSASKIIKRIQEIQDSLDGLKKEIFGEITLIDMRKKKQTAKLDLRRLKTASLEIVRKDFRKVSQIKRTDMRKIAKIERKDLRKLKKTAIDLRSLILGGINLKRLLKKAELFTTIEYATSDGNTCNVYKNPTMDEFKSTRIESTNSSIKGVITNDNDVYIWPSHIPDDIITQALGVIMNGIHFQNDSTFSVDANNKFTIEDIENKLNNIKSIISNTFGISSVQVLNASNGNGSDTINL